MTRWSDEHIVAYLDGKLDMAEGQALHRDRRHDAQLDAYISSMEIDVSELSRASDELLEGAPQFDFEKPSRRIPIWKQSAIAAGIAGVFALGFVANRLLPAPNLPPASWVQAVAEYQMLYSGQTLKLLEKNEDQRGREVAEIGRKLEIILTRSDLKVDGLQLKRSQLLKFKNKPLVQFAYIDSDGVPIAFCIIKRGQKPDSAIREKRLFANQNAAVWAKGKYGFVVIGKKDQKSITTIAKLLQKRMASI